MRWGKRKNTEVSAKSVGLPVVPFQYGLSLFVCLSKWFTFLVCPSVTVRLHGRLLRLLLTFSGLAKVAIFTTNVDAENQTLINHKCVCGALNRHFCQTRVTSRIYSVRVSVHLIFSSKSLPVTSFL